MPLLVATPSPPCLPWAFDRRHVAESRRERSLRSPGAGRAHRLSVYVRPWRNIPRNDKTYLSPALARSPCANFSLGEMLFWHFSHHLKCELSRLASRHPPRDRMPGKQAECGPWAVLWNIACPFTTSSMRIFSRHASRGIAIVWTSSGHRRFTHGLRGSLAQPALERSRSRRLEAAKPDLPHRVPLVEVRAGRFDFITCAWPRCARREARGHVPWHRQEGESCFSNTRLICVSAQSGFSTSQCRVQGVQQKTRIAGVETIAEVDELSAKRRRRMSTTCRRNAH